MRRTNVLLTVASAALIGLLALPAETAAVPAVPEHTAPIVAPAPLVDVPTFGCDLPMPNPFRKYMDRFTRRGDCWRRTWTLVGWIDADESARGLLIGWRSWLRTGKYHTEGRIGCEWKGTTRVCGQTIVMNTGMAYGGLITKVGPIRGDGTRAATVKVWMGYGG